MSIPKETLDKRYTYSDYLTWDGNERYELIDGVPYLDGEPVTTIPKTSEVMSPAPVLAHQRILFELAGQFWNYLKDKACEAFIAPVDVRLNAENDDTVVQPDLFVVCDKAKLNDKGCVGAPDMIIEVLSPATARIDLFTKFNKYLQSGVSEYWIVDPDSKIVQAYTLKNNKYVANAYSDTDNAPVHVLKGCTINLTDVFAEKQIQ